MQILFYTIVQKRNNQCGEYQTIRFHSKVIDNLFMEDLQVFLLLSKMPKNKMTFQLSFMIIWEKETGLWITTSVGSKDFQALLKLLIEQKKYSMPSSLSKDISSPNTFPITFIVCAMLSKIKCRKTVCVYSKENLNLLLVSSLIKNTTVKKLVLKCWSPQDYLILLQVGQELGVGILLLAMSFFLNIHNFTKFQSFSSPLHYVMEWFLIFWMVESIRDTIVVMHVGGSFVVWMNTLKKQEIINFWRKKLTCYFYQTTFLNTIIWKKKEKLKLWLFNKSFMRSFNLMPMVFTIDSGELDTRSTLTWWLRDLIFN